MEAVEVEADAVPLPLDEPVASATRVVEERDHAVGRSEGFFAHDTDTTRDDTRGR